MAAVGAGGASGAGLAAAARHRAQGSAPARCRSPVSADGLAARAATGACRRQKPKPGRRRASLASACCPTCPTQPAPACDHRRARAHQPANLGAAGTERIVGQPTFARHLCAPALEPATAQALGRQRTAGRPHPQRPPPGQPHEPQRALCRPNGHRSNPGGRDHRHGSAAAARRRLHRGAAQPGQPARPLQQQRAPQAGPGQLMPRDRSAAAITLAPRAPITFQMNGKLALRLRIAPGTPA